MLAKNLQDLTSWLENMADELNDLAEIDSMEMYRYLTQMGSGIEQFGIPEKTPANFVQGCTSNVYIDARLEDGVLRYSGLSEALVVRGYVAILVEGLSGLGPQDVLAGAQKPIEAFAEKTNIRATLTPSRANAFGNIFKLMQDKARKLSGGQS